MQTGDGKNDAAQVCDSEEGLGRLRYPRRRWNTYHLDDSLGRQRIDSPREPEDQKAALCEPGGFWGAALFMPLLQCVGEGSDFLDRRRKIVGALCLFG